MWLYLLGAAVGLLGLVAVVRGLAMRGDAPEGVSGSEEQRVRGRRWVVRGVGVAFASVLVVVIALVVDASSVLGPWDGERDLSTVAETSRPLIAAIDAFKRERGRPPFALDELVPTYLTKVPGTGLESWPRYDYRSRNGGGWHLEVALPVGVLDFDCRQRFQYEPDASRDRDLGAVHRIGDWVYIPGASD